MMEPIRTMRDGYHSTLTDKNMFSDRIRGDGGFFCPVCYYTFYLDFYYSVLIRDINGNNIISVKPEIKLQCPQCKCEFTWSGYPLEPNIASHIAELNRKGYPTVSSHEGSIINICGNKVVTPASIKFKYNNQRYVVDDYPLPSIWSLTDNNSEFRIFASSNLNSIKERMVTLRKWINSLEYCFDDKYIVKSKRERDAIYDFIY